MTGTQYFLVGLVYLAIMTGSWVVMNLGSGGSETKWNTFGQIVSGITLFHGCFYFNKLGVQRRRDLGKNNSFLDRRISPIGHWASMASGACVGSVLVLAPPILAMGLMEMKLVFLLIGTVCCLPLFVMIGPKNSTVDENR